MIEDWATAYALPPAWIATVMQIESCGHPSIHSRAGAAGLFQVMPFHFSPAEDPLDVPTNAARGLAYLARASTLASGQPGPALAGYNGGHGLIHLPPDQWPQETQRYVGWGTGILADVAAGVTPSPALTAWLDAGGARLCQQAETALGLSGSAPSG
jgi:soluble lytic murein transglycosylase-like protein